MKLKRFLSILLVIVFAAAVFAGCDVITKNEERDYKQALATVSYKGASDVVTKGEFEDSFNSLAYYYVYYYGYSVEETANSILDSLTQRKLLLLAIKYEMSGQDNAKAVADLLTDVEKNEAVKSANESVKSWYDNIYTELLEEQKSEDELLEDDAEEEPAEEEDTDAVVPRAVRPDMAEGEIDYSATLADADKEVKFFDKPYSDFYEDDYDANAKLLVEKAIAQLKKELADNYIDYDYYLDSAYDAQLISKYQRLLSVNYKLTDSTYADMVAAQRETYITLNKETFANNVSVNYSSALSTLSSLVYHPESEQGYGYVYNILFKFSDEQLADLKAFKAANTDEAAIENYRAALAMQIKVKKSNLNYDPDCTDCEECTDDDEIYCTDADCTCRPYDVNDDGTIKEYSVADILEEFDAAYAACDDGSINEYELFKARKEIAEQYVYMVSDDEGMFSTESNNGGKGYLIPPEEHTSGFVQEFTDLGRLLVSGTDDAELINKYDIHGSGLGAYGHCIADTVGGSNEYAGIFLMFVSYVPYSETYVTKDGVEKTIATTGDEAFCLPLDYVVYYGRQGDENDPDQTLQEAIFKAMKTSFESTQYTKEAQNIVNNNKDCIKKNDKLWKKLMKEYDEQYNA